MGNNFAFARNTDEKAIKRFMDTAPKTERIYLFNPIDAKSMAEKAKQDNLMLRVNIVDTPDGPMPWTRVIDLTEDSPLLKMKNGISEITKSEDGEVFILHSQKLKARNLETDKIMNPNDFLSEHVYSREAESESGLSM